MNLTRRILAAGGNFLRFLPLCFRSEKVRKRAQQRQREGVALNAIPRISFAGLLRWAECPSGVVKGKSMFDYPRGLRLGDRTVFNSLACGRYWTLQVSLLRIAQPLLRGGFSCAVVFLLNLHGQGHDVDEGFGGGGSFLEFEVDCPRNRAIVGRFFVQVKYNVTEIVWRSHAKLNRDGDDLMIYNGRAIARRGRFWHVFTPSMI